MKAFLASITRLSLRPRTNISKTPSPLLGRASSTKLPSLIRTMASHPSQTRVPRDPNTLSNYNEWRTKHTVADFIVDFDHQKLDGYVQLQLESLTDAASKKIVLDSSFVHVEAVAVDEQPLSSSEWTLAPRSEPFGSPLTINLSQGRKKGDVLKLDMKIATTEKCTALQWLTPEQTGTENPYVFSQCQAIHARSLFPCQDTPDVKSTYEFILTSPHPTIASGVPVEDAAAQKEDGVYKFEQKIPMPAYLFALASGSIATASIGPRSCVACTPSELAASKWELENDTENFIQIAEKLVFPYAWGQYNVLVLPGSFPYGGMENPVFTFATPTIISGDRQNIDVIAHELAHSWSGNLVSNASWEHFWLNEGWTVYLERRIIAGVHGEPHRDFSAIIGWKALEDSVKLYGEDHEYTKLVVTLTGQDPDDAFSTVPYEKGFHFLYFIEKLVGKDKFDQFIPYYFGKWQKKSLDSYEFKATLLEFFEKDEDAAKKLDTIDWDKWFSAPGLPPKPEFDTSLVDAALALADKWRAGGYEPKPEDVKDFAANQTVVFLESLLSSFSEKPLTPEQTSLLGKTYSLFETKNVELSARFFQLGLQAGDKSVFEPTEELLGRVGRMKFVRPLYRALVQADREIAVRTFEKLKNFYHPICRQMVEKDLFGSEKK
jgi:leukotriene-A4 hydrolase